MHRGPGGTVQLARQLRAVTPAVRPLEGRLLEQELGAVTRDRTFCDVWGQWGQLGYS
jgi:hypothetical protein